MCPAAQGGGIGRARRIFAVRRGLLNGIACGDTLTGFLPATQAERRRRRQPIGQDGEGLAARMTYSASHPNAFVALVVGRAQASSMADNRAVLANRTSPGEQVQGNHPGSTLSSVSGNAIKRITAGVKAGRWFSLPGWFRRLAFILLVNSFSNEKGKIVARSPVGLAGINGDNASIPSRGRAPCPVRMSLCKAAAIESRTGRRPTMIVWGGGSV